MKISFLLSHNLTPAPSFFILSNVCVFQLAKAAIFLQFGHLSLDSPRQEKPLCRRLLALQGRASVKDSLASDDSNRRNDPGQIMNVWVVPKDLSWNDFALGVLQIWWTLGAMSLPVYGHCPTGSVLSQLSSWPVECQFSFPWPEMKRKWFKF